MVGSRLHVHLLDEKILITVLNFITSMNELLEKTKSIKEALNYVADSKVQECGAKYCRLQNGGKWMFVPN
jgi:hypothetical protein